MDTDKTIITLNKTKLLLGMAGSLFFVLLGNWLIVTTNIESAKFSYEFRLFLGIICVFFFLATFIFGIIKFFSKKHGIIIDKDGIHDNSSALSLGFIPW